MEEQQITLQIDHHFITVPAGTTLLEAARKIGIDRVTAYRQTGLGHDILCFHITNKDSIDYFCHDLCTSNTLLNSSGIS